LHISPFVKAQYEERIAALKARGPVTPEAALEAAAIAMAEAFASGLASFGVSAGFEAIFPEKLNTLNGIGPMLASLAGFDKVTDAALGPIYEAALKTPNEYNANAQFRTKVPLGFIGEQMYARGIIDQATYKKIISYEGLAPEYEEASLTNAYRGLSPFMFIRALETGIVSEADARNSMTFAAMRPKDQDMMIAVAAELAVEPYKRQALAETIRAYERGLINDVDFADSLAGFNLPDGAEHWIHLQAANRKLVQLADLYRRSVSEAYQYGEVSDADYVAKLEAIGIAPADAEAHYAVDSIKQRGRQAQAALRAEAKELAREQRAAIAAANAQYLAGTLDEAGLTAALIAAGEPPALVAADVSIMSARRAGRLTRVYNLTLAPNEARLLRQQVAAIKEQAIKKLITPDTAAAQLRSLGLSERWVAALVSQWAAQADKLVLPP